MSRFWTREQISYCNCDALCYTHTHCPCFRCNGKAVSRSTEYRHWQGANAERSEATSLSSNAATSSTNSCSQNQDQDLNFRLQLDGEARGDADVTLMDTSTTSADVPAEVMATDHVHNLHDDTMTPAHVQRNISDR